MKKAISKYYFYVLNILTNNYILEIFPILAYHANSAYFYVFAYKCTKICNTATNNAMEKVQLCETANETYLKSSLSYLVGQICTHFM